MNALRLFTLAAGTAAFLASASAQTPPPRDPLAQVIDSEELILRLTTRLGDLEQSLFALRFPDESSAALFASNILHDPATDDAAESISLSIPEVVRTSLSRKEFTQGRRFTRVGFAPMKAFIENAALVERAHFYLVDGHFDARGRFVTQLGLDGLVKLQNDKWRSWSSSHQLMWQKKLTAPGEEETWEIVFWRDLKRETVESPRLLFEEVLDDLLPRPEDLQRARFSYHENNIIKLFTENKFTVTSEIYAEYRDLDSVYQHPGLSVVDIDADGRDDLYVMGRWGRNQLLRDQGDGTFIDEASRFGLDIKDFCNCAIFADFDNDGDQDAFIGRSLERSVYLVNEGGRFVDRSKERIAVPLPYLVSSLSAADYNNDGLLDVFLSLYGPTAKDIPVEKWAHQFFPEAMADELIRRLGKSHRYIDLLGPPNLLLTNAGSGRFIMTPDAAGLAEWHNTYQSSWTDYDEDGDPDLYVCNDFAPDSLYRNDSDKPGKNRFQEVSRELAGDSMLGFGMGASWGDYNNDGRMDLYVSNMFSKAGRRITRQIEGLDARIPYSAQGSLLFENTQAGFNQVAGITPDTKMVAKVGWSFGGQFFDADNDGFLDIYSASGYYTAPKEIAHADDL